MWINVVFMVLSVYLVTVYAQDEPQITKSILPEIKRVGMTGRLNCTVTRQQNNKVYWIYTNRQQTITSDDQVELDDKFNPIIDGYHKYEVDKTQVGDRITYQLIIRRLQLDDAGRYTCRIHIKGTQQHPSKDGQMVVLIPPTVIQSQTTMTQNVVEGGQAFLQCNATGYPVPNITWVRPNGAALPDPYRKYSHKGHNITLKDLSKDDRGVYRCIADNNVKPPATHDATLYVNFRPFARPVQTSYGQAQNRMYDIVIECRISGLPEPDLRWYKKVGADGLTPIDDDDKHVIHALLSHGQELSVSEFWYQLTIINVQANDYGEYACEGTNDLGTHQAIVQLYETSECQGPNCPPENIPAAASSLPETFILLFTLVSMTLLNIL